MKSTFFKNKSLIILTLGLSLTLGACSNNKNESKGKTSEPTTEQSKEEKASTTNFSAKGEYTVGEDINPGSYYIAMTDITYGDTDKEHSGYVSVGMYDSSDKYKDSLTLYTPGIPQRITIKKGEKIKFDDNYSPNDWTITFYSQKDFDKERKNLEEKAESADKEKVELKDKKSSEKPASSKETKPSSSSSTPSSSSSESTSSSTVFKPQDVSDSTIKSIKTYNDYLTMYNKILEDYYANYESALKGTAIYNEEAFKTIKESSNKTFEEQKKSYGSMGDQELPESSKDTLVEYLISLRDSSKEIVESLKQ